MPDLERRLHRKNDRTEPLRRRDALPRVRRCMSRRFFLPLLPTRSCAIGAEAFPISSSCFYICTFFGRAAPDRAGARPGARPYQRSLSQDAEIRLLNCSSKTLRLLVNVLRPAWRISTRFRNVWPAGTRSQFHPRLLSLSLLSDLSLEQEGTSHAVRAAAWIVCDMCRPNVLHAGRAEQISAETRMAYRAVADDIDERSLASPQCTFEGRAKLLRPLDVLTVTIHELEHPVVALVR